MKKPWKMWQLFEGEMPYSALDWKREYVIQDAERSTGNSWSILREYGWSVRRVIVTEAPRARRK